MNSSSSIELLASALVSAQAAMSNPEFDATNPHFRNQYASLASVRKAVMPVLNAHGLSLLQQPRCGEGRAGCAWMLIHKSGQFISDELTLPVSKNDAQGAGSAITYARRYTMQSIAGVVGEEDDDGNEAVAPAKASATPIKSQPKPPEQATANHYTEVSAMLKRVGCKTAEDADLVLGFLFDGATVAKAKADPATCRAVLDCYQMALVDHKSDAAILPAARAIAAGSSI
jgi:hypothetical protein